MRVITCRCPVCGFLAYKGLKEVECTNTNCRWYFKPKKAPLDLEIEELERDIDRQFPSAY